MFLVRSNWLVGGPPEFMKSKLATGRVFIVCFAVIIIALKWHPHSRVDRGMVVIAFMNGFKIPEIVS